DRLRAVADHGDQGRTGPGTGATALFRAGREHAPRRGRGEGHRLRAGSRAAPGRDSQVRRGRLRLRLRPPGRAGSGGLLPLLRAGDRAEVSAAAPRGLMLRAANVKGDRPGRRYDMFEAARSRVARRSRSRTSSSVVWVNSSYHRPTARNGSGVMAQTTSSTWAASWSQVARAATGTATTVRSGCSWRSAATAA